MRASAFLAALFVAACLANSANAQSKKLAVCSTTQIADFTRQIVGDRWEVTSVLGHGQDPHTYETKTKDANLVARADLCLDNGWHLEGKDWMRRLADDAGKTIVSCVTGVKPYELEEKGGKVEDPHAWFTPSNAAQYVRNILSAVSKLDAANQGEYEMRAELYLRQLRALDLWITKQVSQVPKQKRILVTSHDAFNYFCNAYGFRAAAPLGWSTKDFGGGLKAERRQEVIESIRSFGVKAIFVETSVSPELIEQIANDAGVEIGGELYSDSMGAMGTAGETYIGMMRENVLTIVKAMK
jgi:manganese/iron transport system substrate-binding protein